MVVCMSVLWLDTETRSKCDLKAAGSYNYAQDPSTELLCLSYAFDNEDVHTWVPKQPFPQRVADYFTNGGQIRVHNASFDRLILWYVVCPDFGVPSPKLEQFYCTATQARANCAPGSLEDVGRFAGADMKKDRRGDYLVRQCCIPPYNETLIPELIEYCEQDVRAMRAVSLAMRQLSDDELLDYHVNERINDRGVKVDVALCRAAVRYADAELAEIQAIVSEITGGLAVRSPRMREWVLARVTDEQKKLMWVGERYSIDKAVRANLLACDDLDPDVREVVQCADDLWASSIAKFKRLQELADVEDDRVRGAFVFAGGSATGRASSYGAQVHNFTRKTAKDPAAVRDDMVRGRAIVPVHGRRVTDVLKGMLRPALIGNFVAADWSAIEARVNPWMSGMGEEKLAQFSQDIYKINAAATFGCTVDQVTDDQRQIGKVQELSCGYAGGVGAFAAMGRAYGIHLPEADARRMVDAWRRSNQWAVRFWSELERAYTSAMHTPNAEFSAGRVTYLFDKQHLWYILPSGRVLCYPFAKLEDDGISYCKAAWKPAADAKEWPRARLWKGLACENITQAVANDVLRHALRQLDNVVLHVHDEIVLEDGDPDVLSRVMCTPPPWAVGLPLKAEVKQMSRYGK
jgi:DNA polymerase